MRVGFGTDVHFFTPDPVKRLVLAGFPFVGHRGVEADSDGDVALHALCNALSSAVGGKSMGFYVNEMCRNGIHNSERYVETIFAKVQESGFTVGNVSLTFECTTPRIDPFTDAMKANIAKLLQIEPSAIGITASRGNRFDDRVRVYATVLIESATS